MATATITVTLPNGEIAKRRTARTYTHALCSNSSVIGFCGSYELAQKRLAGVSCPNFRARLQIIPVNA